MEFSLDMFNLVSINKLQRSRLIFDFSAKVAYIGSPTNILKHSFLRQLSANWNQISYDNSNDWLAKTYTNCYGHMTNMATMPIYGKNSFKSLLLWNKNAIGFGTWYVGSAMWALPG